MGDNTHANTFFLGGKHDGTEQGQKTGEEIRTLHRRQGLLHSPRPVRSGDRRFRLVTAVGYEDYGQRTRSEHGAGSHARADDPRSGDAGANAGDDAGAGNSGRGRR